MAESFQWLHPTDLHFVLPEQGAMRACVQAGRSTRLVPDKTGLRWRRRVSTGLEWSFESHLVLENPRSWLKNADFWRVGMDIRFPQPGIAARLAATTLGRPHREPDGYSSVPGATNGRHARREAPHVEAPVVARH